MKLKNDRMKYIPLVHNIDKMRGNFYEEFYFYFTYTFKF